MRTGHDFARGPAGLMLHPMPRVLLLLRHGRAGGQAPAAPLLPEGVAQLETLAARLVREGGRADAVFTSRYLRARDTTAIVAGAIAPGTVPVVLDELVPETPPREAMLALLAVGLPEGRALVVAHLPLVGLLCQWLTGEDPGFHPGTLAEIALDDAGTGGRLVRVLGPGER